MKIAYNRLKYEDVKNYVERQSCRLLEKEYINNETKMKFECSCGNNFETSLSKFKHRNQRCKECGQKKYTEKRKFSFEYVKGYFRQEGCLLLDHEYIDIITPMNYVCSCGNKSIIAFNSFKNSNTRCMKCGIKKSSETQRHTHEKVVKIFKDEGCVLLEEKYINNRTKMKYICSCKNESKITLDKFTSGQRCKKCGINKKSNTQKIPYKLVKKYFENQGCELLEEQYINCHTSMEYICVCGNKSKISYSSFQTGVRCKKCAVENNSGENHHSWKGGISPIHNHLRKIIFQWKNDSLIKYNYRCAISNTNGTLEVHHLFPFKKILEQTMYKLDMPIDSLNKYTDEEIDLIEKTFIEIHNKYGLGVPLTKEIHYEFHSIYGRLNFTPEDFEEFKQYKQQQSNNAS